jgi:hypothetical protein
MTSADLAISQRAEIIRARSGFIDAPDVAVRVQALRELVEGRPAFELVNVGGEWSPAQMARAT